MRRIVTAVNDKGESFVASDEAIPDSGFLWTHNPADTQAWIDAINPGSVLTVVQPPPRGVIWVLAAFPPGSGMERGDHHFEGMDDRGFHVTRTVDFIYVLDGGMILDLDHDSVELASGDVVVLQVSRHSWRNPTDRTVRFIDVVVSGVKD
jgi:mannose-6-phosphate isomerase-like protein (cupin superfamily)